MSGRWDDKDNVDQGWKPKHRDLEKIEDLERLNREGKILSVSEAARQHEGKDISVRGIISGVQPLRKMIKGVSVRCTNCNKEYTRMYDKPELFESFVPIERIRKCVDCKTAEIKHN